MEARERPKNFHPQDWIIIVEALAQWAGPPQDAEGRSERAYELIESISAYQELPPSELVLNAQTDPTRER